jgi:hypothetical protein
MDPIEQAQESSERMALIVAQYYDALCRNGVPHEVAERLTLQYQDGILRMAAEAEARKAGVATLSTLFGKKP